MTFSVVGTVCRLGRLPRSRCEKKSDGEGTEEKESLAQTDYQLYEALNLLKGLSLQREQMR